jgi:chromosomal replication initiator protein
MAAGLLPGHTFDRFIEGKANQHARAVAFSFDSNLYSVRHPLCIYGAVGLGKTHLMHAIGHKALSRNPRTRVKYVHALDFFDQLVQGNRDMALDRFRESYNSLDVLLLDDIQFLKFHPRTQEQLRRILDTLTQRNCLIVIAGDCLPQKSPKKSGMDAVNSNLMSRIDCGQTVELHCPDVVLRMNCLIAMAEREGLVIASNVARYMARRTHSKDMRFVQGAFNRLMAYARFHGEEISLATVRRALRGVA